uniref:AMP-dependent synthetase/ligase domain-containing protein n=1 Tax=Bionectria ochroleuca TaxID=29856 RepID=A0A8H7NP77_BIOOC
MPYLTQLGTPPGKKSVFRKIRNVMSRLKSKSRGAPNALGSIPNPTAASMACPDVSLSERFGVVPTDMDLGLWDIFTATAARYPNRDAIVSLWQQPHDDGYESDYQAEDDNRCLRWSYQQLLVEATRIAICLRKLGCRPNMRLAAVVWNSAEWGLFFWVAASLGMVFAPIDPRVPSEAQSMLQVLKPDVIVVQDDNGIAIIDDPELDQPFSSLCIRICCSYTSQPDWINLWGERNIEQHVMNMEMFTNIETGHFDTQQYSHQPNQLAVVVFTSGTTGKPKGCPHTNQSIISQTAKYDPNPDFSLIDRWLVHTPVSHIFAINNALRAWRYGGAAIFPSKTFNVQSTIRALRDERITIMSATPTLVKILLADPLFPDPSELCLEVVTIAATTITQDDIDMCRQGLGAKDAIQAYGMSEGAPTLSWARSDELLVDGFHPGVGKALPGVWVRICDPATREVLPYGQLGEIHLGGYSVISSYLDGAESKSFYQDGCGTWLMTGDQGCMDSSGVLYVRGRYKDIIIRGGENINPFEIESAIAQIPGVQAAAIGVPDDMGGEVPVAVASLPEGVTKSMVSDRVAMLDAKYMLAGVYTLKDLGLEAFPLTSMGKVKKNELKKAIKILRQAPTDEAFNGTSKPDTSYSFFHHNEILNKLVDAWEQVTGTRPKTDTQMTHLADSISMLRYCDAVYRSTGKILYLQDVVTCDTVDKQAELLATRSANAKTDAGELVHLPTPLLEINHGSSTAVFPSSFGSKTLAPLQSNLISSSAFPDHRLLKNQLEILGLSECVVEDMIPIKESLHRTVIGQRPQSYHVRMVFRATRSEPQHVRQSLERCVAHRPMMRTILLDSYGFKPSHIVIKASRELLHHLIHDVEVETEAEAQERWSDDSYETHSSHFMLQGHVISVRQSSVVFLSVLFSHSIIDALSLWPFHRDLEYVLSDINAKLSPSTPFRLFSDLFSQYEDSEPARQAVLFHTRKLRGISRLQDALWPPQRAPGWMISNDAGSHRARERALVRAQVWEGDWEANANSFRYPRQARIVCLPHLAELQRTHGIQPSLFAKAAVVLFNTRQTGASHAIFNTWESGRTWPFVPQWMHNMLPPAMSIDGPTASWLLRMATVSKNETLLDFLGRFASECDEETRYDHVPWQKVIEELRDEGAVADAASYRQSFVWDVTLGLGSSKEFRNDSRLLEFVSRLDWGDCGFFWNMFMIDSQNLYFVASWDTAQMNDIEVEDFCECMADTMRKMAKPDNWNKTIGQLFGP